MKQKEMHEFLIIINNYYPNFEVTKDKTKAWQSILYFVKVEDFRKSLGQYVRNEEYPPTIAGLLNYWKDNHYQKSTDKIGD